MSFMAITVLVLVIAGFFGAVAVFALTYKPKQITYLSPEALDAKSVEIESIHLDAISNAYTQADIDAANRDCDDLYNLYKLRR